MFFPLGFRNVVVALYIIMFGSLVILAEFALPSQVVRYASFLMSFIGRGMFYIFMGALVLAPGIIRVVAGSVTMLVGAIYVVLEFTPSIEPPSNMREENEYETPVGETV
ncbi:Golgi apparatus membrane protein TVP15 [Dipodascopsis uninucleata]